MATGYAPKGPKVYRRTYCQRAHRTHSTTARCVWRRAEWVARKGPYATLAWCRVLTVELHATLDEALAAKRVIDASGCGGRCRGRPSHEVIRLALPAPPRVNATPAESGAPTHPEPVARETLAALRKSCRTPGRGIPADSVSLSLRVLYNCRSEVRQMSMEFTTIAAQQE